MNKNSLNPIIETLPQEGEAYFRECACDIVANIPEPILICDDSCRIIAGNKIFFNFFKQKEKEVLGRTLNVVFGEGVWRENSLDVRFKEAFTTRGELPRIQVEGDFPDIGEKILALRIFRVRSEPRKEYLVAIADGTEEVRENRLIHRSKSHLLEVFDGIKDPIAIIDKDLNILRLNRSMLDAIGAADYHDCLGRSCHDLFHGRQSPCNSSCVLMKTFVDGEARQTYWMMRAGKASGKLFDVITYPLFNSSGAIHAVVMLLRDIARSLEVEAELYESERARVLGSLAAGIAHEIRNPLAVISSTAQYCKTELPPGAALNEEFGTIMRSCAQANSVITALMDFAKPREVHFEIAGIDIVLNDGLNLVRNRCMKGGINITQHIEKNLPKLKLDRQRITQAYVNILLNAIDSMPHGGKLQIDATRSKDRSFVDVIVRDTGTGVPKELVGRVFQPFYSTRKDGVGLGLPIADGIIHSHGGKLTFSGEGKGSAARFELPVFFEEEGK